MIDTGGSGHTGIIDATHDLVHSPDDGGWYLVEHPSWRHSIIYPTEESARAALRESKVEWEEAS